MREPVSLPLDQPELTAEVGGGLIRRTVHPSGIRILSEHMPGARSASIGFWVGVGSRDEQAENHEAPGSLGSTHFLEHLLFKGTPERDAYEIATSFDRIGAENNALTAKEYTCYYAKVRDEDLEHAVAVLSDMVTSSMLDAEEFETERGVILEELAMAADDPGDVAGEKLFEEVLAGHPLGRPIGGSQETILAARREDVDRHYHEHYVPSTLVVSAAGAVDHDRLVEWVLNGLTRAADDRWNPNRSASPVARRPVRSSGVPADTTGSAPVSVVQRPSEQVNLMVGTRGFRAGDSRRFAFGIMNAALGGGMSSRLFQEIRERRGLAYSTYSFGASYSDDGLFGMYAGTAPHKAVEAVRLAREELQRIAADGITEAEHELALGQIAGSSALALEDSDTRMGRLGRAELGTGELYGLDASLARFALVTNDDIRAVARELAARPFTVVAVGSVDAESFAEEILAVEQTPAEDPRLAQEVLRG